MSRPRIYDENHFRLSTYTNKAGKTYIYGYRNEWNKEKKQSRVVKRQYVGTFDPETGKAKLGPKFLSAHPEYAGKDLYYENNELVERNASELEEINERQENIFSDDLSVGATWACWETAKQHGIYSDLCDTFGKADGSNLLRLGIYQYLVGNAMAGFEDWIPDVYVPGAEELNGRRISELLSRVDHNKMKAFFKRRHERRQKIYDEIDAKNIKQGLPAQPRFLAIDSTGISTYSTTIEQAAYGHAKQNPELKQVNLTLGVDYLSGDVCYAYESEGSINDKALYPHILKDMQVNGFDLTKTTLVTDRGYESLYNIQRLLNLDLQYVAGVPLIEKGIVDQLKKYHSSLSSIAFYNGKLGVSARTVKEHWHAETDCGSFLKDTDLHLYKYQDRVGLEQKQFVGKIEDIIAAKNEGKVVDPLDWKQVSKYISKAKDGKWEKNIDALLEWHKIAGCFAIRSNCIKDPFEALMVYRKRGIVEMAFRQFKVLNSGARLYATESTYVGKLMVHLIAQSLRMIHLITAQRNQKGKLQIPGNSMDKAMAILGRVKACRPAGRKNWITREIPKKARDVFELLGISLPPLKFTSIPSY